MVNTDAPTNPLENVLFSRFFSSEESMRATDFVRERGNPRVVFIDTPATSHLVELVSIVKNIVGAEVVIRDHHDVDGTPSNPREREIAEGAALLRDLIGENAVISTRAHDPGCAKLVAPGEFAEGWTIIADADADGFVAVCKALGLVWEGIDQDGAILDGAPAGRTAETLTATGWLLSRCIGALPQFDPQRPKLREDAQNDLFRRFATMLTLSGEERANAAAGLEEYASAYAKAVEAAKTLATTAEEILPGVIAVSLKDAPKFDMPTLARLIERADTLITVQTKDTGPIAAVHGWQVSMALTLRAQGLGLNLQDLLDHPFVSGPESGIISNTKFLLHVSPAIFEEQILLKLEKFVSIGG